MADYENTSDLSLIQELVQVSSAISIDMNFYTFDYYTTTLDNQIAMTMSPGTDKFISVFNKAVSDANNIGVRFKKGSRICFTKGTGSYTSFTIAYYDTDSSTVKYVSYSKTTGDDLHRGAVVVDGDEDFFVKVVDVDTRIEVSFKENVCVTQLDIHSGTESETLLDSFVQLNDNKMEYKNTPSLNSVLITVDTYSQSEIDNWSPTPMSSMQRIANFLLRINQCKLDIKDSINTLIPNGITSSTPFENYSDVLDTYTPPEIPEEYVKVGLKHKGVIYTPEISRLSLTLTPYDSSNTPIMTSDFVAGPFTYTTKGYYIPPKTLWNDYSTIKSFECNIKYKFTSMPTDLETIVTWERLFGWEYMSDGRFGIWNYTEGQYVYQATTPVTVDTWYWMNIQIDSSRNVTYSLSTDGENYTQLVTFVDNTYSWSNIYSNTEIGFGYHTWIPDETRELNCGVIDFKETNIKINGNDVLYYFHQNYGEY